MYLLINDVCLFNFENFDGMLDERVVATRVFGADPSGLPREQGEEDEQVDDVPHEQDRVRVVDDLRDLVDVRAGRRSFGGRGGADDIKAHPRAQESFETML